jgi:hypothetical protein
MMVYEIGRPLLVSEPEIVRSSKKRPRDCS